MEDRTMIGALVLVFSLLVLSDQLGTAVTESNSTAVPSNSTAMVCVHKDGRTYVPANNCTNGRGISGCCVERTYCDYNTSNIDLTMYGRRGYRVSCGDKYVCCPLKYVLPVVVKNALSDDDTDFDDDV